MPTYDYFCETCKDTVEIFHWMSDESPRMCEKCGKQMIKCIGCGYAIIRDNSSDAQMKRDIGARQEQSQELKSKPIKRTHSGKGSGQGKALAGQHMEVSRQDFIKAAAKDPVIVAECQKALKKSQ